MKLSIIMPAFNEAKTLPAIIQRVQALPIDKELIVVDDGSTDESVSILKTLAGLPGIKVLYHPANRGKAAAIKTGIAVATGDIIAIQDADLEYNPAELLPLAELVASGKTAVAYGSRYLKKKDERNIYYSFKLGVRVLSITTNLLYGQHITDEATCYKVFRADLLKSLPLKYNGFAFCPEVTARVSKLGYKITEIAINYFPRSFEEGKKIGWRDGARALWVLIKLRFVN